MRVFTELATIFMKMTTVYFFIPKKTFLIFSLLFVCIIKNSYCYYSNSEDIDYRTDEGKSWTEIFSHRPLWQYTFNDHSQIETRRLKVSIYRVKRDERYQIQATSDERDFYVWQTISKYHASHAQAYSLDLSISLGAIPAYRLYSEGLIIDGASIEKDLIFFPQNKPYILPDKTVIWFGQNWCCIPIKPTGHKNKFIAQFPCSSSEHAHPTTWLLVLFTYKQDCLHLNELHKYLVSDIPNLIKLNSQNPTDITTRSLRLTYQTYYLKNPISVLPPAIFTHQ